MKDIITINNQEVTVKEYNGQRVVTFKDIDTVHGRPDGTARKRFADNRKHFVEGEDFFIVTPQDLENSRMSEKRTSGIEEVNLRGTAFITEQGYLMLVKSFTDDLAWDVQRQLVKSYFTKIRAFSTAEQIQLIAQGHIELEHKIENVKQELDDFKQDMPLLAVECERITTAVHKRGVDALGGKNSNAYMDSSLRGKVYQDIHRELKRQFGVSTYKAIKRNQCDIAVSIVEEYELPFVLQEQIEACNAQMNMEVA